jgi:hypothetical protein
MAIVHPKAEKPHAWTSKEIQKGVCELHQNFKFNYRKNLLCVPNTSGRLLPWEADLLVVRPTKYVIEIEVKVSMSDWYADKSKDKWNRDPLAGMLPAWQYIKEFWYAVPDTLAKRWSDVGIPDYAGVMALDWRQHEGQVGYPGCPHIIRPARPLQAKKLDDKQLIAMGRLAAMRIWERL